MSVSVNTRESSALIFPYPFVKMLHEVARALVLSKRAVLVSR